MKEIESKNKDLEEKLEVEKEAKSRLELEVKRLKDQLEESQNDERELHKRLNSAENEKKSLLDSLNTAIKSCQSGNSDLIIAKEELKESQEELEGEQKSKAVLVLGKQRFSPNQKQAMIVGFDGCIRVSYYR